MPYNVTEQNKLDQKLPPASPKWDQAIVDAASLDAQLRYLYSDDEEWYPHDPSEEEAFESWKAKRIAASRKMSEQD